MDKWPKICQGMTLHRKNRPTFGRRYLCVIKPPFNGACFGAVSAPTLSARVPRRARAAFENERFHYEHSACFHGADCRAD